MQAFLRLYSIRVLDMPTPCTLLEWKHICQKHENSIMLPSEDKKVHLGKGNASCEGVEQQQPLVLHVAALRFPFRDKAWMWLVPDDLAGPPTPLLVLGLQLTLCPSLESLKTF